MFPFGKKEKKRQYVRHHDRFADGYAFDISPEMKKSILIIGTIAIGGISFLSLFGLAGFLGNYIEMAFSLLFGWGKFFAPIFIIVLGYLLYHDDKPWVKGYVYVGLFFFVLSFQAFLHIFFRDPEIAAEAGKGGGYVGLFLSKILISFIGFWGGLLAIICLIALSLILIFSSTIHHIIGEESILGKIMAPFKWLVRTAFGLKQKDEGDEDDEGDEEDNDGEDEESADEEDVEFEEDEDEEFSSHEVGDADDEPEDEISQTDGAADVEAAVATVKKERIHLDIPLDLLSNKRGKPSSTDIKLFNEIIKQTMENFGIKVEMGNTSIGPTVTQYTFKPADGVKLSRITGLSNDLSLALALHPIRIEAPIPGQSLVGVEVPNRIKARVGLREILDTEKFKNRTSNMMVSLGKDVAGKEWLADLAKMPHLLVAGATGTGKSVCLNSIILSLIYQNDPDDIKFIMVDPKRVELSMYNNIPYLLTPVITDVPKTINALKWCINEMERRFNVLSQAGKRNIENYNMSAGEKLPYIVFVIDELADLMSTAANDVEGAIIRLAQMARAVGIHLVLATQRPSVDVITGLIKANIPVRIAFRVASAVDSRTILDSQGAEKLLGDGDMLFTMADVSKPKRIQGSFVDEKEVKRITRFINEHAGGSDYNEDIISRQKVGGAAGKNFSDADSDDLYEEAKEMVINSGKASTSFLQRRLRIGYARAARLIDLLEDGGIVGPANGAKAREILISKEQYAKIAGSSMAGMPLHNRAESQFDAGSILGDDDEDDSNSDEEEDDAEAEEEDDSNEENDKNDSEYSGSEADDESSDEEDNDDSEEEVDSSFEEEEESDRSKEGGGGADKNEEESEEENNSEKEWGKLYSR
ncbi:MAG: DNA translocase FtsK 4TM domain-containing protein [bacterium]|nr:DNA translocase FtsK 4TM domain-containing protein [bacterium]